MSRAANLWRGRWAVNWWRVLKVLRVHLQIFYLVVYSCNGVVFDKDRYSRHDKGDEDGYASGKASNQCNAQGTEEFAEKVNPSHLRIQLCQGLALTTDRSNGKFTLQIICILL